MSLKEKEMKDMFSRRISLAILCCIININSFFAQTNNIFLKGCWVEVCAGMTYEYTNGEWKETSWVKGNEQRSMLLLSGGIGRYFLRYPNYVFDTEGVFEWSSDSCKYTYRESKDCPYTEELYYKINSSESHDSLIIEHKYKNPHYIVKDLYVRKKIEILPTSEYYGNVSKFEKYNAYNKRYIDDQKPLIPQIRK